MRKTLRVFGSSVTRVRLFGSSLDQQEDSPSTQDGVRIDEPAETLEVVKESMGPSQPKVKTLRKRIFSRQLNNTEHSLPLNPEQDAFPLCCTKECLRAADMETIKGEIREALVCKKKLATKKKLLQHLISQEQLGICTDGFNWKGNYFCCKSFSNISDLSVYLVRYVLLSHRNGVKEFRHGNNGLAKFSVKTSTFKVWVRGFLSQNSQSAPDSNVQVIPHWITRRSMYKVYQQETTEPHLARTTFILYLKRHFGPNRINRQEPQVRFSKYSSHSICDQCCAFNNARRTAVTEQELDKVNQLKTAHMVNVSGARERMEEIKQNSIRFPNDSVTIQIDGMDNSKSYCPRLVEKSKKSAGLLRLPTKIQGCILYSGHYIEQRKVLFYLNHDHFQQSSNMVVSTIYKLLQEIIKDQGKLPKKLRVFADNCYRENKNRYLFAFLDHLVELGIFEEATIDFLIVGHTGNEVDQLFSILTTEFKSTDMLDVESLKSKILNSPIKPKPVVESMMYTWDWKESIETHLNPLQHHSFFNSFKFSKDNGQTRLRYKKLPQSPEYGPVEGIQLFATRGVVGLVQAADFRIESLNLDKLVRGLQPLFQTLNLEHRMLVVSRWDALKKTLEALPLKKEVLPRMDLDELPRQIEVETDGMESDEEDSHIQGTFFETAIEEGVLEEDMCVGMDVCVYTEVKRNRPWVGRVTGFKDRDTYTVNWYEKDKATKSGKYVSRLNDDQSLYTSDLDFSTVMMWAFSESKRDNSFVISPVWQDCLKKEYAKMDRRE